MKVTRGGVEIYPKSISDLKQGDRILFAESELGNYPGDRNGLNGFASRGMYEITFAGLKLDDCEADLTAVDSRRVSIIINIRGQYYIAGANAEDLVLV